MNSDARPGGLGFDWGAEQGFESSCPNCGAGTGIEPLVMVSWTGTRNFTRQQRPVHHCASCGARFYAPMAQPEYHHEETRVIGWPQLHVQQNAGVWPIAAPLARIAKPAGSRFLEIGGGFGFGLDFAIHGRAWQGHGIDPSRLAAKGADELNLPVTLGYFPEDDKETAPWDVIAATEVIEHVAHPGDFLAAIRKRLADDGVLVLTTPDGGLIEKTTPAETLERILIPEIHMVFQTEASLRHILRDAGFPHAEIHHDTDSLIGFASPAPLNLDSDPATLRRRFRAYLDTRAASVDATTDAGIGLLGRTMFEAANDGDVEAAGAARERLFSAIKFRYGIDRDPAARRRPYTRPDEGPTAPQPRPRLLRGSHTPPRRRRETPRRAPRTPPRRRHRGSPDHRAARHVDLRCPDRVRGLDGAGGTGHRRRRIRRSGHAIQTRRARRASRRPNRAAQPPLPASSASPKAATSPAPSKPPAASATPIPSPAIFCSRPSPALSIAVISMKPTGSARESSGISTRQPTPPTQRRRTHASPSACSPSTGRGMPRPPLPPSCPCAPRSPRISTTVRILPPCSGKRCAAN